MSETPLQVAHNPAAPASERYDAGAEAARLYAPLNKALLPSDAVRESIAWIEDAYAESEMAKAMAGRNGNIIDFPGRMKPPPRKGMQSVWLDDMQIFATGDYFEKPAPLGFEGLRQMVEQTPVLNSVIMTRVRQMSRFCQPSEDGGPGFEIRHIDRKHILKGDEAEAARLLSKFFQNCGWEFNARARKRLHRDTFKAFMARSYRDSLTYDAAPIETEFKRDKTLGLDGFYAVDGSTIRLCTEAGYEGDDQIFALQVVNGRLATAYNYDQLVYEVRNPRADVRLAGYGQAETETLIRVVTGFLNAMTYNISAFDNNAIPKGMLHITGNYAAEDLAAFKRYWNATVRGINNAWALPVMVSKDQESKAAFEKFGVDIDEMSFSKWMTFLVSIICSIFGMSPEEINFESFSAGRSSLSGTDTTEKLAASKDSGLFPDMAHFESVFTDFLVSPFADNLCFRWVGLKEEDEKWGQEAKKLILTVDELRAEEGYGPMQDPMLGSAPLNPSLVGPWMQAQQPAQQPDYGTPADDGGHPDAAPGEAGAGQNAPLDEGGQADAADGQPNGEEGQTPSPPKQTGEFGGQAGGDFGKAFTAIYRIGD